MRKPAKSKKISYAYKTVMLIDDNDLDNFINQKVIEGNYFAEKVYINSSGISALEFLKNISVDEQLAQLMVPECIFIDINMPIMDGFQFLEQFYQLPESITSKSRLVILTSSVNPADRTMADKMDKNIIFLNKPLTDESLLSINPDK